MNMNEPGELYEDDPFFKKIRDANWNATVGRQGHEENYLDGYIEAAIELVDAIINKEMMEKRDTLVLPILYNARHALELGLKFATEKLMAAGAIKNDGRKLSHDISAYWNHLYGSNIADEALSKIVYDLQPFVASLSQVDSDGQELRYHRNRDNDLSLEKFAIVNLKLAQGSLKKLQEHLRDLKYRTLSYIDEYHTRTGTNRCSRSDLHEIARMLPPRDNWSDDVFNQRKAEIIARYRLSSKQFVLALDELQKSRETKSLLGIETPLLYLSDDDVKWVISQWRRLHPKKNLAASELGLDYFDTTRIAAMKEDVKLYRDVIAAVEQRLSEDQLAELEVMYYLDRNREYSEYFERMIPPKLKEHLANKDRPQEIRHLLEKTNFLQYVRGSARKLGRLVLVASLENA